MNQARVKTLCSEFLRIDVEILKATRAMAPQEREKLARALKSARAEVDSLRKKCVAEEIEKAVKSQPEMHFLL